MQKIVCFFITDSVESDCVVCWIMSGKLYISVVESNENKIITHTATTDPKSQKNYCLLAILPKLKLQLLD